MEGRPLAILVNAGWAMPTGVPCTQPPYGGIRAIDLASARRNFVDDAVQHRHAEQWWRGSYCFLPDLRRYMRTGKTVWSDVLHGGGQANLMIYEHTGRSIS